MLEELYKQLREELDRLSNKLTKSLSNFVDDFDHENRIAVFDNDKISEYQELMDNFFKKEMTPFLGFLALKIRDALQLAQENFAEDGAEYEDIQHIEEALGIEGGKIKKYRDGKMTILYALGSLKVLENDVITLLHSAMNGQVARVDLKKAVVNTASRKYHDFFDVYAIGSVWQSFNTAQRIYAGKFKYNKFIYAGGIIEESRDFCVDRAGKEFFFDQGLEWNELDWKGKIPGVDFFVQCGGYNCLHHLEWIKE
jgi:hypothetical protein